MKEDTQSVKGGSKVQETAFDLNYNIAALCVAILREDIRFSEDAFAVLTEKKYRLTDEDTMDMIKMDNAGVKHEEIIEIYGISEDYMTIKIREYKRKRISQTAILKDPVVKNISLPLL